MIPSYHRKNAENMAIEFQTPDEINHAYPDLMQTRTVTEYMKYLQEKQGKPFYERLQGKWISKHAPDLKAIIDSGKGSFVTLSLPPNLLKQWAVALTFEPDPQKTLKGQSQTLIELATLAGVQDEHKTPLVMATPINDKMDIQDVTLGSQTPIPKQSGQTIPSLTVLGTYEDTSAGKFKGNTNILAYVAPGLTPKASWTKPL